MAHRALRWALAAAASIFLALGLTYGFNAQSSDWALTSQSLMLSSSSSRASDKEGALLQQLQDIRQELHSLQGALRGESDLYETRPVWPGQLSARAPCAPPHCEFLCATPPEDVDCRPPPREPARPRVCSGPNDANFTFRPLPFAIPAQDVVACVPKKSRPFSSIIPGYPHTYTFGPKEEAEYKRQYRNSYFALTEKKAGWDCLRHYEILASGALPFFWLIEDAPQSVMAFLPRALLSRALRLPGVSYLNIDFETFNHTAYHETACQALAYTRAHLTTRALAGYLLESMGKPQARSVLMLTGPKLSVDYTRDLALHGLRELLGVGFVDYPKIEHMYMQPENATVDNEVLYGMGFSLAHRLPDDPGVNRAHIKRRIEAREFDLVIFGVAQEGTPMLDLVTEHYGPEEVVFVDGDDWRGWSGPLARRQLFGRGQYFVREMPDDCPQFDWREALGGGV